MKHKRPVLSPIVYAFLGSAATAGLLIGAIAFTQGSRATNPIKETQEYRARGSGRDEQKGLLLKIQILIGEETEETPKKKKPKTKVALEIDEQE